MARLFDADTEKVRLTSTTLITAYPFTVSARINFDSFSGADKTVFGAADNSAAFVYFTVETDSTGKLEVETVNGSFQTIVTTNALSTGVWYDVLVTWTSATFREIFIDGVSEASGTTSVGYNTLVDTWGAGESGASSANASARMRMADFAVWSSALSAQEITNLSNGQRPYHIDSANLVLYWPLWGSSPEADLAGGGNNGTVTGATVADHAPIGPYILSSLPTNFIAAVGVTNPKGPLGHPLVGALGGPI